MIHLVVAQLSNSQLSNLLLNAISGNGSWQGMSDHKALTLEQHKALTYSRSIISNSRHLQDYQARKTTDRHHHHNKWPGEMFPFYTQNVSIFKKN